MQNTHKHIHAERKGREGGDGHGNIRIMMTTTIWFPELPKEVLVHRRKLQVGPDLTK